MGGCLHRYVLTSFRFCAQRLESPGEEGVALQCALGGRSKLWEWVVRGEERWLAETESCWTVLGGESTRKNTD